jgi:hypothetical protein
MDATRLTAYYNVLRCLSLSLFVHKSQVQLSGES